MPFLQLVAFKAQWNVIVPHKISISLYPIYESPIKKHQTLNEYKWVRGKAKPFLFGLNLICRIN